MGALNPPEQGSDTILQWKMSPRVRENGTFGDQVITETVLFSDEST